MKQQQLDGSKGFLSRATGHLGEVELGYFAHLRVAAGIGGSMIAAGVACLLHAFLPGIFQDRASRTVETLHRQISKGTPATRYLDSRTPIEFEI